MDRPTEPRIAPLDFAAMSETQRAQLRAGSSNVLQTLVRHEALLSAWLGLGQQLLFSERVSPRERELVVLRVALRTRCEYEWSNHVLGALAAGVGAAEIHALSDATHAWSVPESATLHAVDELCADDAISDATWDVLRATRSDDALIELVLLIGYYRMNAGMLNALGVQPEAGRPRLGEVPDVAPASRERAPDANADNDDNDDDEGEVRGTWQVVFEHPAGNQDLVLELHATPDGALRGSVSNPALGVTIQIVGGAINANRFEFNAPLEQPVAVDLTYSGAVHGDTIAGEVRIRGAGSFPFRGKRATT